MSKKTNAVILFVISILMGISLSWGDCRSERLTCGNSWAQPCSNGTFCIVNNRPGLCQGDYQYYGCGAALNSNQTITDIGTCNGSSVPYYLVTCSNSCEVDSLSCVSEGGTWIENQNSTCGKSCRTNACTAEDTLKLQREKEHCDSLGATNNFELANNSNGTCGFSGICNLCSGNAYRNYVQNLKERCCELGKVPDSVKCVMKALTSTQNDYAQLKGDGCLSTGEGSVIITPNGESVVEGCENFNSSNSQNQSSDSQNQSSSSECVGLDCPSSSSGGDISADLEDIKDSLHKIIIYDSTTASNSIDLVNYLYDIKTCLEAGTCGNGQPIDYSDSLHAIKDTLHRSNEYLKQIADKDLSVQVNGGLTAEKQAALISEISNVAEQIVFYGGLNGEKLDSIVSALKNSGMDSIAHKLDSMRNDKLDSISGGIYSLDSTFAYWGDSSNWKMDSAGWGGKYDSLKSWGDSLTGAMGDWLQGCDTTGGEHCDNIYIGSHGLDSATSGMKGAAKALRDSMLNGRFADSLDLWASKFNNPKISGSGSNTCPSALTRFYNLNFGSMGEVQMGSFGTYLCEPIFGSVTPWTLGRILLRAIVAISCMWFLFKCATGFKGDSGEED